MPNTTLFQCVSHDRKYKIKAVCVCVAPVYTFLLLSEHQSHGRILLGPVSLIISFLMSSSLPLTPYLWDTDHF